MTSIVKQSQRLSNKSNGLKQRTKINLWCWAFMLPITVIFLIFQFRTVIYCFIYSFQNFSGISSRTSWAGFDNFISAWNDPLFWNAFANTFIFVLKAVPVQMCLALIIALALNSKLLKARNMYRSMFFIPVVTTMSIVGIIMVFVMAANGPINIALTGLGLNGAIDFLGSPKYAMNTAIAIYVWKWLGLNVIYWIAGLQAISPELYEAAMIDGAGFIKRTQLITLPLLIPIGSVILLLDFIATLKVFDLIKTLTDGGPYFATDVITTYLYRYAFSSEFGLPRLGYASAVGILFGMAIVIIIAIVILVQKRIKKI